MSKEKSKQTLSDRYSEMTGNNSNNPLQNSGSHHKPLIIGGIAVVVAVGIAIATVSLSGHSDTGDTIYESPYIPVGSSLEKIKLNDESLSKGTYPCTLTYHLVDEQHIDISTLNISISVVIEND